MRINIVTNTFGNSNRQEIAIDSWIYLKKIYPDLISIYDLQFIDNPVADWREDIITKNILEESSQTILNKSSKRLPLVSEILEKSIHLSELDDYIIFLNSDIILMPNIIEYIIKNKPNAMSSSRMDIADIKDFSFVLNKNITPIRYECFGSDVFVFSKKWLMDGHKELFSNRYFYGSWRWDNVWTAWIKLFNPTQPLGVYFAPYAFHIHHGLASVMKDYPEKDHNQKLLDSSFQDRLAFSIYSNYLNKFMLQRLDAPRFLQLAPNELEKEIEYFNSFKI